MNALRESYVIHIALRWSAGIGRIVFYRHIAPLERKLSTSTVTERRHA